ncbi:MAG TPA: DUF1552 domain-containing protein [Polyangiaceae bacterium]|nr:DUF1552 domain-containing protein [Polyangiaceae bacterium]
MSARNFGSRVLSRRNLLRGAGVAITLPWLESLAPRVATAQAAAPRLRFLPIFLPNGSAEVWTPGGQAGAWQLSSILEPFAELKAKMQVLTNLENGSSFNANGSASVEPSHGRQPGAWLTCVDPESVAKRLGVMEANGVSVDQIMAAHQVFAGKTKIPSLQIGLSTVYASCDGKQCSNSRSVSWRTETQPTYKQVDPLAVFNSLTGGAPVGMPGMPVDDAAAKARVALQKSVLDGVLENATSTRTLLSSADQKRMDEFLESVRAVEKQVVGVSTGMGDMGSVGGANCQMAARPTMATVTPDGIKQTTGTYNKGDHADAMNALIVMAFQCDLTRIITYMLEDERSEFTYDHVDRRKFSATTSTVDTGKCGNYHGSQHGSQDEFATISWWNAGKVADLCRKLDAIKEENGMSILDNSVVLFGGCMHGSDHSCDRLPTALIGGGGGKLHTDQHVVYPGSKPLRDLHFTLMNDVFGLGVADFGSSPGGKPVGKTPEILKV